MKAKFKAKASFGYALSAIRMPRLLQTNKILKAAVQRTEPKQLLNRVKKTIPAGSYIVSGR